MKIGWEMGGSLGGHTVAKWKLWSIQEHLEALWSFRTQGRTAQHRGTKTTLNPKIINPGIPELLLILGA